MPFFGSSLLSTAEAKTNFFLTPADLKEIPFRRPGGWGFGQMKLYERSDLMAAALRKHGEEGLAKKREKMKQKIEKKRKAEQLANEYAKILNSGGDPAALGATFASPSTAKKAKTGDAIDLTSDTDGIARVLNAGASAPAPAAAPPAVDAGLISSLRAEARRHLKALCSFDYLRSKNSPNGCGGTVRIERVDQPTFAALIGRAADPELKSLVRQGAWYSTSVHATKFFGEGRVSIRGSGGRYNSNQDVGILVDEDFVVKYSPSQRTVSVTAYVAHLGWSGGW